MLVTYSFDDADGTRSRRSSTDRIPELFNIDHAQFYQCVYAAANRSEGTVDYSTLTRTFDQKRAGELVDLLELWAGRRAEDALTERGVFIPHPLRVELTSLLFETARIKARGHSVDEEIFRAMLDTHGSYESARDTYFGEHFSRDQLIREAAERFVRDRPFRAPDPGPRTPDPGPRAPDPGPRAPGLALHSAVDVLTRMFRSHILELQRVLVSVGLVLFDIAVEAV